MILPRPLSLAASETLELAKGVLSVLIPPLCIGCEAVLPSGRRWLCSRCSLALWVRVRPRRRRLSLGAGEDLEVRYPLGYSALVSGLIAEMKYGDKPGLASFLARIVDVVLPKTLPAQTLIVPVPMHASKRRERGYNQSQLLGRALAGLRGFAFGPRLLVKRRNTVSQTTLERGRRIENVVGSFGMRGNPIPVRTPIVLVDDVVTTGSTLKECTEVLRSAGMKEVSACVVASSQ